MKIIAAAITVAAVLLLTGCADRHVDPATVETHEVDVAVAVPCKVDTKNKRPALLTIDQFKAAYAKAPLLDDKVKLTVQQLLAYMGWLPVVEDAMKGCKMAPIPKP